MMFDNQEEDCIVYIEELKSDDPDLKINAVSKVAQISHILGPVRTREELIPYILDIIEECDNEDEFLIKLADQILLLKDKVGDEFVYKLVAPLEQLTSMEEVVVREKAVNCLIELSKGQPKDHFLTLIKQLSIWENYTSRVSSCYLISHCYNQVSEQERIEIRQLFSELANDDTPMVRRAAAANIGALGKVIEREYVRSELLPLWNKLMKDDIDSVRIKAIESAALLSQNLASSDIGEHFLPLFKNLDPEKKSWRVRYALAEILPSVIEHSEKDIVKKEIITVFEHLLSDSEQEVKSISALKVPALCEKLTELQITNQIFPLIQNLASDPSQHVRQSVANILVKVSKFLSGVNLSQYVIPTLQQLFKDEALDVRSELINSLGMYHAVVGKENVRKYIIPLINSSTTEKNWRTRLAVVEYIPRLCKDLGYEIFKDDINPLIGKFLFDHIFAIRDQSIENFKEISKLFGYDKIKDGMVKAISELSKNANYLFRITAIQSLLKLKEIFDTKTLNALFEDFADKMTEDKVPNVRFNLLKVFKGLKDILSQGSKLKYSKLFEKLLKDGDSDVAYFADLSLKN